MLKNYFKSALRSIFRAKLFSLINIVGFALGLTVAIIIGLWTQYQLSYDEFNVNANRIYRVTEHFQHGDNSLTLPVTPAPLASALEDLPQVKSVVRLSRPLKDVVLRNGRKEFNEDNVFYSDRSLFRIFTFHFLEGDAHNAFSDPYSVVLTEPVAKKLFPGEDPIDRTVDIGTSDGNHDYTVTGVIKPLPGNSQFHPKVIISRKSITGRKSNSSVEWYELSWYTYFLLARGARVSSVTTQFPAILIRGMGVKGSKRWKLGIQRLTDIHLHSHLLLEIEPSGYAKTVIIVFSIGAFILLISLINFITLSAARFSDRAKEVGVRKVIGAGRRDLVSRFITESALLALISGVAAISLAEILTPFFNSLSGSSLTLRLSAAGIALAGAVLLGALAGSYPALFLSSFRPTSIFRKEPLLKPGRLGLRRALVVLQFTIAVGIVIATIVAKEQLSYVENKFLGFNKDRVIVIPLLHKELSERYPLLKREFSELNGIESVSGSSGPLGKADYEGTLYFHNKAQFGIRWLGVDYGFLKTMGIRLVSGRSFSPKYATDTSSSILVNESAAKKLNELGLFNKPLSVDFAYDHSRVIGVLNNFNYRPLYYPVQPLVISLDPKKMNFMDIRIASKNIGTTLLSMRETWKKIVAGYPPDFRFLDQSIDRQYLSDERLSNILSVGSLLGIFISAIGLFGLASYMVEKRIKEIGIRRILGASVGQVVLLLGSDYMKLVVMGYVIACPLGYYIMNKWLENFAYRIVIGPMAFVEAGVGVLVITMSAVIYKSWRAATVNPSEALRYE